MLERRGEGERAAEGRERRRRARPASSSGPRAPPPPAPRPAASPARARARPHAARATSRAAAHPPPNATSGDAGGALYCSAAASRGGGAAGEGWGCRRSRRGRLTAPWDPNCESHAGPGTARGGCRRAGARGPLLPRPAHPALLWIPRSSPPPLRAPRGRPPPRQPPARRLRKRAQVTPPSAAVAASRRHRRWGEEEEGEGEEAGSVLPRVHFEFPPADQLPRVLHAGEATARLSMDGCAGGTTPSDWRTSSQRVMIGPPGRLGGSGLGSGGRF